MLSAFAVSVFYHLQKKRRKMRAKSMQDESNMEAYNKRIAADLHDDLGSLLTGLKLSLRELSLAQPDNTLLDHSAGLLERSISRMREVSLNLTPRELQGEGLHAAIESFVERMDGAVVHVRYTASSFDDFSFNIEKSMLIYRVIQEMTTNAIKHSGATLIEIGIAARFSRLIVEVRDNGSGFDYETASKKKNSSGLKNIQSRLELLNAVLSVESAPDKGTHYFINIPLRELKNGTHS